MFRILGKLFEMHFGFKACIMLLVFRFGAATEIHAGRNLSSGSDMNLMAAMRQKSGNSGFQAAEIEVVNNRDGQQMIIINRCSTQLGRPHRLKECIYCLLI